MMQKRLPIIADLHTHTVKSHLGQSTLSENIRAAKRKQLLGLGITEYGPKYNNSNFKTEIFKINQYIPHIIDGIKMYFGVECNVMDMYSARIDLELEEVVHLDYVIASYHKQSEFDDNIISDIKTTSMLCSLAQNPAVMIIGHPDRYIIGFDIDKVLSICKTNHKIIELNSFRLHIPQNRELMKEILLKCKEMKIPICVTSDAHISYQIGDFSSAIDLLNETDFPDELIINNDADKLEQYIEDYKKLRQIAIDNKTRKRM